LIFSSCYVQPFTVSSSPMHAQHGVEHHI
jgi:hypothetical protein